MGLRTRGDRRERAPWRSLLSQRLTLHPPSDYKAFEDAAEEFHPYIPFFATFDSKVFHPRTYWGSLTHLSSPLIPLPESLGTYSPPAHHTPTSTSGLPHTKDLRFSNPVLSCPIKAQKSGDTCPMSQWQSDSLPLPCSPVILLLTMTLHPLLHPHPQRWQRS